MLVLADACNPLLALPSRSARDVLRSLVCAAGSGADQASKYDELKPSGDDKEMPDPSSIRHIAVTRDKEWLDRTKRALKSCFDKLAAPGGCIDHGKVM